MSERGNKKTLTGVVVSDKMEKTVVVVVEQRVLHDRYKKYVRRQNRFMAHDERNDCRTGDRVIIEEARPLSRRKRWRVKATISRAPEL